MNIQPVSTVPLPIKNYGNNLYTELGIVIKNQNKYKNEFQIQV